MRYIKQEGSMQVDSSSQLISNLATCVLKLNNKQSGVVSVQCLKL